MGTNPQARDTVIKKYLMFTEAFGIQLKVFIRDSHRFYVSDQKIN